MSRDVREFEHDSVIPGALRSLTQLVTGYPFWTLLLAMLVSAACIALTINSLGFKTDRADLIDPSAEYHRRWLAYTEGFGDASDLVVVVEGESPDQIKQIMDDLGGRMEQETDLFANVLYKVDTSRLRGKGLQYLQPEQLETLINKLEELGPVLKGRWDLISIKTMFQGLGLQLGRLDDSPEDVARAAPLLRLAGRLSNSLDRFAANPNDYDSPWQEFVTLDDNQREEAQQVHYSLNDAGTFGFLLAQPRKQASFEGATPSIDRLRQLIAETTDKYPHSQLSLTGIPVLESDEMRSSQSSMFVASLISFIGVALVLAIGFRGLRHPLMAMIMLAFGMAWSFGFTTLAVGHLNILSVSFVTILVGLGIDFGILYLSRYLEVRQTGAELNESLAETSYHVGPGILTAAITTSLAFLCALFTDFLGVAELGVIASGGILLCAVASFVVLPALISLADRKLEVQRMPTPFSGKGLRQLIAHHPIGMLLLSLAIISIVGSQGFRVKYDYNLLNLQAEGLESVEIQQRIVEESDSRLLFAVSLADSPARALELKKQFEALPKVHHVTEVASFLPVVPPSKTHLLVQAIDVLLKQLPREMPTVKPVIPASVGRRLESFHETLEGRTSPDAAKTQAAIDRFLDRLDTLTLEQQTRLLTEFQTRMVMDLLMRLRGLQSAANPAPVSVGDLPAGMASRFVSPQGQWLLQIYPKDEIWDIEPLSEFITEVRSVDPNVTGTPLQNYEASRQIRQSYEKVALYALLAVAVVLLVDFMNLRDTLLGLLGPLAGVAVMAVTSRWTGYELELPHLIFAYFTMALLLIALIDFSGLRNALLTMLPPIAGAGLMMGVLGICRVDLNPANLIVLPLIIGIGVDNGVHVMHDFRSQTGRYQMSGSILNAILLSGLTTMIGFGSMIIAAHRGLSSLGMVLVVGVGSCLTMSLIVLPSILTVITNRRHDATSASGNLPDSAAEETSPRKVSLSVYSPDSAA